MTRFRNDPADIFTDLIEEADAILGDNSRPVVEPAPTDPADIFTDVINDANRVLGIQVELEQPPRREMPTGDAEEAAIEAAKTDRIFELAREVEIETGEVTHRPLQRFNQLRRERGLEPVEELPYEVVADLSDRAMNAIKSQLAGFADTANRAVEGIGDMADALTELVGIDFEPPTEFFEASRNVIKAYLPDDPRLRDEFFSSQLPRGLGSTLGFAALGASGGVPGLIAGGVAVGGQEQAERARSVDAPAKDRAVATLLGGALGLTETALPLRLGRILKPVDRVLDGRFFNAILTRGGLTADIAIEAGQEMFQQAGSNVIAKTILKQDTPLLEGIVESGKVGGGVGAIFGVLTRLAARMAGVKKLSFQSPEAQKGADAAAEAVPEPVQKPAEKPSPREVVTPEPNADIETQVRTLRRRGLSEKAARAQVETPSPAVAPEPAHQQAPPQQLPGDVAATMAASQTDPPGVPDSQVEFMGMPTHPSPPLGGDAAPFGDMPVRLERPAGVEASISAPKVIDALAAIPLAFGRETPIRVGRVPGHGRGAFKVQPEVIRIKTANDIRSAAHEVGHAIDHITLKGRFENKLERELTSLGKKLYGDKQPSQGYSREGFAEFVYLWMTNPAEAKSAAPKTTAWFEKKFLPAHPGPAAAMQRARESALLWAEQGSLTRVEQSMVDVGSLRETLGKAPGKLKRAFSISSHIEALQPLDLFARAAEKQLGRKLKPGEDPFAFGQSVRLAHDARLAYMLERGMMDASGNHVGPSLKEGLAPVKDQIGKFKVLLYARRAQALWNDPRHEGGRNPGITLADAEQVIREISTPKLETALQAYYDWNDGVLNYAAQLSPTFAVAVARIREADPGNYAPLLREMGELDNFAGGQASVTHGTLAKRLKGSGRRVHDLLTSTVQNAEQIILAGHRRYMMDHVIRLSKLPGMGHLVENVGREMEAKLTREISDVISSINQKLGESGRVGLVKGDKDAIGEMVTLFAPETTPREGPPTIPYQTSIENPDGTVTTKLEFYRIDPALHDAIMGLDHVSLRNLPVFGTFLEWTMAKPRRMFVTGTTGLRMSFGLVTNPQRDLPGMYIKSQANANGLQMLYSWARSMFSVLNPKGADADPYFDAYLRLGVQSGQVLAQDVRRARRAARTIHQGKVATILDPRTYYEGLQAIVQRVEAAPRLAEFRRLADDVNWRPGEPMTLDQATHLLLGAKQVTTDFSASGSVGQQINQAIPFYNANIQAVRAEARAAKRNHRRWVTRSFLVVTVPTLLIWWYNKDKEWWKELPAKERALYWWIDADTRTLIKIPRPFEVGQVFGAMPEAFLDSWYNSDPEMAKKWFTTAFDVMLPDLMPVIPREAWAQARNWDSFWERPVVPQGVQGKPPGEQFTPFSSRAAIFLGNMFASREHPERGVSPARIDHAIRGVAGPVAGDVIELLGLGPAGVDRESEAADLPIIGRMFRRGGHHGSASRSVDKVYDLLDEAQIRQRSDVQVETEAERQDRLMLTDAARTISNLFVIRSVAVGTDRRARLMKEAVSMAQDALRATESGYRRRSYFKQARKRTEKERSRLKGR